MQPSSETLSGTASIPPLQPQAENFEQTHYFSTFANWIIPSHVVLGRYPYVEPGDPKTHERRTHEGEEQLRRILNAGITTFICLQATSCEQNPPQQEMERARLLARAIGTPPGTQEVNGLRNQHDRLRSEPTRKQTTLHFEHWSIKDFCIPTAEQAREITTDIRTLLESGEKVYMHCFGGAGRSGTLGACLLGDLYRIDAEEALMRIQKAFNTRGGGGESPETEEQIEFVKRYLSRS
ncbi:g13222 [Coccomyxa viridis]|uniref:G13222 protein n=1 Tax=Coccomyxa viridis TaxID=1274662 RepID=A0ABP1GC79_9CHLO